MTKVEPTKEEYDQMVVNLSENFSGLVKEWSDEKIGELGQWINLFKEIMDFAQKLKTVPGLTKANICIDVIAGIASGLIENNVADLPESSLATVKMVLSDSGMQILKASTTMIKNLMGSIDTNNDNEISMEELGDFFCGCCSLKKKK